MEEKYLLNNGQKLIIDYQEDPRNPRDDDNIGKLCIREHRNYKFPNELDFDFARHDDDGDRGEFDKIDKKYYIFWIDCYEHSGISFSLAGKGMQCKFDTSRDAGFIAIPKGEDKLTGAIINNEEEARKIAEAELKEYNQYLNGEVLCFDVLRLTTWKAQDGTDRTQTQWEISEDFDSCGGYYSADDILEEFKEYEPKEIE